MSKRDEARALTVAQPTPILVASLRAIAEPKSTEETMVRAWIMDVLEERFPTASAAVENAFEIAQLTMMETGVEPEVDYVAVLLANIPEVAA